MIPKKPETLEEWREFGKSAGRLLVECRDAICFIPATATKLGQVSPTLDKRIESLLEPFIDPNGI